MDVRRLSAGGGVVAALLAVVLLPVPPVAVAASGTAALAAPAVRRGTSGVALASLALGAAAALTALALAGAGSTGAALVSLFAVAGLAGCFAVGLLEIPSVDERLTGERRTRTDGRHGGGIGPLLGAWTALVLPATAVLVPLAAAAQPFGSLLGARLSVPGVEPVLFVLPVAVTAIAGWGALVAWRRAGLPPWPLAAGPGALIVAWSVVAPAVVPPAGVESGALPAFDFLLPGSGTDVPVGTVLLWSAAIPTVASALAGTVAAEDAQFRRGPAWIAVAAGPLALVAFVAFVGGGVFLAATLAAIPPVAEAFGAVLETVDPAVAAALLVSMSLSGLAVAVTLPARAPLIGGLTRGRPAGVGAGCLLVAVALAGAPTWTTAAAGGLAVLAGVLLAHGPAVAPPPRTALSRAGVVTLAVGAGSLLAVSLVDLVPRTDPGVGGALLLVGVAVLGLAIR